MYLRRLVIENVRSIERFELALDPKELPGWHVILGENGAGKSTIVRSIALAMIGPDEAKALRQIWATWLRDSNVDRGSIHFEIERDAELDGLTGTGRAPGKTRRLEGSLLFTRSSEGGRAPSVELTGKSDLAYRTFWGKGKGWFSASYGPFRRFTGGTSEWARVYFSNPKAAPHLSAFGEDVALTEALEWLKSLRARELETHSSASHLDDVRRFLNGSGMLPHGARLADVTSERVIFTDGSGCEINVEQLSDGYRSILSLTFELIRQMVVSYSREQLFSNSHYSPEYKEVLDNPRYERIFGAATIDLPGIVTIDEIDAHLHPTWQSRIGEWFLTYFPKVQFFVTTHSPIICRAAQKGTIWRLPTPGSGEAPRRVEGKERERLLYGNLLDAYDTQLFGEKVTRSDEGRDRLEQLAALNQKAHHEGLSDTEEKERARLRAATPTAATVD